MEENITTKTSLTKNLNKLSWTSVVALNVDANANIKTVLDTESYLYDIKVEAGSGKAVVSGRLGVKVLYIDTDNITNTLTDNQTWTETLTDTSITTDAIINAYNYNIANTILGRDGSLKISCEISINPIMSMNVALASGTGNFENLIVKKSEINTCAIDSVVDTAFDYSVNFETKEPVAKILMYNSSFSPTSVEAEQGKVVVEGKLFSTLIYETAGDESEIKELTDTFALKTAVEANVDEEDVLDILFNIDKSKENITTETDADGVTITVAHNIVMKGVSLKTVTVDVVDDMYSVENEVELNKTKRDYCQNAICTRLDENVSGDVEIEEDETAIDKIVANLNVCPEITNTYIKDGNLTIEGIISSRVVYIDENREYKQKQTELPFIINTKIKLENLDYVRADISLTDCRAKSKRGTIIELDYNVKICVCYRELSSRELLNNFTLGKPIDFGGYDYQIFIAKPNETMWDLCKRTKVTPDELSKLNNNLPPVMEGGEKIIIKR